METDTHRGRIHAASRGRPRLLNEFDAEIPRKQRSSGERWGYHADAKVAFIVEPAAIDA